MNRREFLKTAAAGSAAVVTTGALAADKTQAPRVKPKTPKLGLTPDEMPKVDLHGEDYIFANKPFAGKVTCNGRPMPGVMVTNGRDTVKTNEKGEYVLPEWEAARFVSITTPSGYSCKSHYDEMWGPLGGEFLAGALRGGVRRAFQRHVHERFRPHRGGHVRRQGVVPRFRRGNS